VACDQYSSERDYWKRAEALVAGAPSTLSLIFPEAYLEDADAEERIARIQAGMRDCLARGILAPAGEGLVLVERFTPYEKKPRVGLVLSVDLEAYRYGADSKSLIRPTEGTIVERLPPRMRIRRGAELELPHIMLLLDDPSRTAIEPVYAVRGRLPKLYDFDLMLGSGRVRGWRVSDPAILGKLADALGAGVVGDRDVGEPRLQCDVGPHEAAQEGVGQARAAGEDGAVPELALPGLLVRRVLLEGRHLVGRPAAGRPRRPCQNCPCPGIPRRPRWCRRRPHRSGAGADRSPDSCGRWHRLPKQLFSRWTYV